MEGESMSGGMIFLLVILAILLIWGIATINRFVRLRQHIRESWSDIDVELKRRYDLIPNLVETVKGYASHEREVLERVVELRNRAMANTGSPGSQGGDESQLLLGLKQIFALAEGYPELKADQHFLELQRELARTEDRIAAARRFYNGNVRTLNALRESVPTNVIAGLLSIQAQTYFQLESGQERAVPQVGDGLNP
jgi:LemA protein